MLIPNQMIEVKWVPLSKDWFENKGYIFTRYRDSFYVKAEDLPLSSHKVVKVKCDYCGDIINKEFVSYLKKKDGSLDSCNKCKKFKIKETIQDVYGCDAFFQTDVFKEKSRETCLEKYGFEKASQSEEVKEKTVKTNMKKYGVISAMQTLETKEKLKQSWLEKYGVENVFQSEEIKEKIKQSNLKLYGVENPMQSPDIVAKTRETLYKNGTVPTSSTEKIICNLLHTIYGEENCIDNFTIDKLNLDCLLLFDGNKIDVEYDGWHWHKDKQEKDMKRNYWLISQGYKVLRIRSNYELPTKEQIIEGVDYLVKGNHHLCYIDLDIDI